MELEQVLQIVKTLEKPKSTPKHPLDVGRNYFIRTVTHYYTGKLTAIVGQWLVLDDASWIADTGRFHDFLKDGKCNEYESFVSTVRVPLSGVIDITDWNFPLFKGQK